MAVHWNLYASLLLAAGALLVGLAAAAWRQRTTPSGTGLVAMLLSASIWVLLSGAEHLVAGLEAKILCSKLQYLGIASVPVTSLVLVLQATGRGAWVTPGRLAAAGALPALTLALALTNEWHGWIWSHLELASAGSFPMLVVSHGPAFWLLTSYAHGLLGIAGVLWIAHYAGAGRAALGEAAVFLPGFCAPWIANLLYLSGRGPWPGLDLTPFGLAVTGVAFTLGFLSRHRLFDAVRLARGALIDMIDDAILVADLRDRLVYANPAARGLLALGSTSLPAPLDAVLSGFPALVAALRGQPGPATLGIAGGASASQPERSFDLRASECREQSGAATSRIAVLRDVTERHLAEEAARLSEARLRQIIDLVPNILFAKDAEGRFLFVNAALARALGRPADQIEGRSQREFESDPLDAERSFAQDREVLTTGRPLVAEREVRTPAGKTVVLQTTRIPFLDSGSGRSAVVCISIDVTRQREQARQIETLAYFDSLTGLPNRQRFRRLLDRSIEHAERNSGSLALLFVDLDRFKNVNDQFGHGAGDALLQQVAYRLLEGVRATDWVSRADAHQEPPGLPVSRLGGDEFTILLSRISDPLDPDRVARRVLEAMSEPFRVGENEIFISASIGIAVYPADGQDAETLLARADQAMYHAKRAGRQRWEFFTESMSHAGSRKHRIEQALHRAESRGELTLHYQPVRDSKSGVLCGAEALLRWWHPELGAVSPGEFIPAAEDSGLIVPIGLFVLRSVCEQLAEWRGRGFRPPRVAVNVSGRQLTEPDFAAAVGALLRDTGTRSSELELEITESAIMRDDPATERNLEELHAQGIALTLDDFGTGYSSLSYLRRFPFERLKIDRSFVADLESCAEDRALTAAVVALARSLHIQSVAEGVETEGQAAFLRGCGCDQLQGYLLSMPIPAAEFERFLEREKSDGE